MAGNAARDNRKARISPRHLMLAVKTDEELAQLFKKCILPESGVVPNIQIALVNPKNNPIKPAPVLPIGVPVPKNNRPTKPAKKLATSPIFAADEEKNTGKKSKNVTLLNEVTLANGQKVNFKNNLFI